METIGTVRKADVISQRFEPLRIGEFTGGALAPEASPINARPSGDRSNIGCLNH